MSENAKDIGQRVRGLREDLGLSAADLAARLQVSPAQYQAWESASVDIPASALNEIALALKVDLGLLLTGVVPRMSLFSVTRAGHGAGVDRRQGYSYENLAASFRSAHFEPFLVTLPETAPDEPIPQNAHPGQECNCILEGRMRLKVRDNEEILEAGDSVIFDASRPHGMKAIGGQARFIAVISV